jgi:Leucine-rich repeat (LRR) protein
MAATTAGAIAWNVNAADRARPSLAELGVEVLSTPDGLEAIAGSRFKPQSLPEADRLLAKLPVLRALDLSRTEVASVEPLKGLTALRSLDLSSTQIAIVDPLKSLSALRELNLNSTQVANLEPLRSLTALRTLDLSATKVTDLRPLQDLPNLTKVNGVSDEELKKLNAYRGAINLPLVK